MESVKESCESENDSTESVKESCESENDSTESANDSCESKKDSMESMEDSLPRLEKSYPTSSALALTAFFKVKENSEPMPNLLST